MYAPSMAGRLLGIAAVAGFAVVPAAAQITGTISSTIVLEKGCIINGTNTANTAAAGELGKLTFGTHTTLFTTATAELLNGANPITVQCTPGASPAIAFGAGLNLSRAAAGQRAMKYNNGSGDFFVGYNLYSDSARENTIADGGTIALNTDGTAKTINVYATAFGGNALVNGTYSDTIIVTITM